MANLHNEKSQIILSVIIPTYNRSTIINRCLSSVADQNFPAECFELIIVDNQSTDNTAEIARSFINNQHGKLNVKFISEKRKGDVYARHTGAMNAEGEILYFTDDDAVLELNMLSTISDFFKKYQQVGAVGTRILIKWDKTPSKWVGHFEYLMGKITYGDSGYVIKKKGLYINNGSLAIKRDLFFQIGGNNPGQFGEVLVGDGEAGLCRKLHKLGVPIGFTDDTCMWHLQFKAKNGRFKDIKRRVQNNAFADAYNDLYDKIGLLNSPVKPYKKGTFKLLRKLFVSGIKLKRIETYRIILECFYEKKYRSFLLDIINEKNSNFELLTNDFLLNENYICEKPILRSNYKGL